MKSEKNIKQVKQKKRSKESLSGQIVEFISKTPYSYILIVIACLAVYIQVAGFGITRFDDNLIIFNNIKFLNDAGNIPKAFTTDAFMTSEGKASLYRPLQTLSFFLDAKLSGEKPIAYHITNLILYCLTCLSLLLLLRLLGINKIISFFLIMIYAVNPLFVIDVSWLPARGDILLALFAVISFIGLIKYNKEKKYFYLILHFIGFVFALFSKETAMVLPLLYYFYIIAVVKKKIITVNNLFYLIAYIIIALIWLLLHTIAIQKPLSTQVFGIIPFFKELRVIPETIFKFIFPFYTPPLPAFNIIFTIGGGIIILLSIIFIVKTKAYKNNYILFGLFYFLLLSIPGMFYRHEKADTYYDYLDHRSYLTLIGILISIAYLIQNKFKTITAKFSFPFIGIILLFSVLSFMRAKNFNDPVTFYIWAVSENPKAAVAYTNLGVYLNEIGKWQTALEDFNKALEIDSSYSDVYINRGLSKKNLGDFSGCINDYTKAIEKKSPSYEFAYYNRASQRRDMKDFLGSIEDYTEALKINPNWAEAYTNRANSKYDISDSIGALEDYEKAIEVNPNYETAYYNRGTAYGKSGYYQLALNDLNQALAINPNYSDAYMNRANVYIALNNMAAACEDWKEAAKRGAPRAAGMIQQYCYKNN